MLGGKQAGPSAGCLAVARRCGTVRFHHRTCPGSTVLWLRPAGAGPMAAMPARLGPLAQRLSLLNTIRWVGLANPPKVSRHELTSSCAGSRMCFCPLATVCRKGGRVCECMHHATGFVPSHTSHLTHPFLRRRLPYQAACCPSTTGCAALWTTASRGVKDLTGLIR